MIRRIAGVIVRPRTTFAALVTRPAWVDTWLLLFAVFALCGSWLLSTDIGQQSLVDERVRVVEAFGGTVSDAEYRALQARPPWGVYLTSGGRLLITPPVTLGAAAAIWLVARLERASARFGQCVAIAVHASVPLAIGQLVATPLNYGRESLTSPVNLAAILPLMEEGTLAARFAGSFDVFALWWAVLMAVGLAALTRRALKRYLWPIVGMLVTFGAIVAAVTAVMGGQ